MLLRFALRFGLALEGFLLVGIGPRLRKSFGLISTYGVSVSRPSILTLLSAHDGQDEVPTEDCM